MQTQLVAFVKENRHIQQWSHPYIGLFLLKSAADIWTLSMSFRGFFTDANSHLLVPISLLTTQGILPIYVWEWLNQPDQASIGGLLGYLQEQPKP